MRRIGKEKRYNDNWISSIRKLYHENKVNQAHNELLEYMEEYPNDNVAKILYGQILYGAGNYNEALKIFENLRISSRVIESKVEMEYAKVLNRLGRNKEALEVIEKLIDKSNDLNGYCSHSLVTILLDNDRADLAEKLLQNVEEHSSLYYIDQIRTKIYLGDESNAKHYLKQIKTMPEDREELRLLAEIYYKLNNTKEVFEIVDKLSTKKDQYYYQSLNSKASCLMKLNKLDEAKSICNEIASSGYCELEKSGFNFLGLIYMYNGSYKKSRECFEEALKSKNPKTVKVVTSKLGLLEQTMNNYEEAKMYYDTCLKDKESKDFYSTIYYISIEIKEGNFSHARNLLRRLRQMETKENENIIRIFDLLISKGKNKESKVQPINYIERQIVNYSEEACLNHIIAHRKYNIPFNENIDIKSLYEETKNNLNDENKCYADIFDAYLFDYKGIGKNTDQYIVFTLPNTHNVITMYPYEEGRLKRIKDFEAVRQEEIKQEAEIKQKKYSKFYRNKSNN